MDIPFDAAAIAGDLIREYYAVLNENPELAWCYYATHGNYRTVYPDGTTAVATTRTDLNVILTRPADPDIPAIAVDTIFSVPNDSPVHLLVQATGKRFVQSFNVEYQPGRKRQYIIVASIATYLPTETADRHTAAAADNRTDTSPPVAVTENRDSVSDRISAKERLPAKTTAERPPVKSVMMKRVTDDDGSTATDRRPSVTTADGQRRPDVNTKIVYFSTERLSLDATMEQQTDENYQSLLDSIIALQTPVVSTAEQPVAFRLEHFDSYLLDTSAADRRPAESAAQRVPDGELKLFVGCMPKTMSSQELSDMFGKYGKVMWVKINAGFARNGLPSKSNYGFIKFDQPASIANALADRPIKLKNGHTLNVNSQFNARDRQ